MRWDSGVTNVKVEKGLFNAELAVDPSDFTDQGLWLRIYVNGEWLAPRQEMLPAPFALTLRPGAKIQRADAGVALEAMNTATDGAVNAHSTNGYGLHCYSENSIGVYGVDAGATQSWVCWP